MTYARHRPLGAATPSWAQIVSPRRSYQLTDEDVLWAARATQFEGGTNPAATLWTHGQKFGGYSTRPTFTDFIRAYSQPINPLWDELTDEKCVQNPSRCTPAQIERRRQARTISWEALNPRIRDLTTRWAMAQLSNPVPRAVEFADQSVSEHFLRNNPGSKIVLKAGNWYLATRSSSDWPLNYVTMREGDRIAGASESSALPLILLTAAVAGGAYYLVRRAA